ncbi:MAG: YidC/Oxa1 family membrane protein insertase [bacterium]
MMNILTIIFYQPLLNALVFLYNIIPGHDIGVAIIILTILIKLILYPFSIKSLKAQKAMQELQPKIDAIKAQYKNEKEKQATEMMKLYKDEKISPFSSCLPLLIQLPFLFAIYQVFMVGLANNELVGLYSFINNPGNLNKIAFWIFDMSKPNLVLALVTGLAQFWQTKMLISKRPEVKGEGSKDEDVASIMNKQMLFMMPIVTVFIGASLPSGLVLYWLVVNLITVGQQYIAFKKTKSITPVVIN